MKRAAQRLEKLLAIARHLPEIDITGEDTLHGEGRGARSLRFSVRKKSFAYYLNDHHGDGVIGLCCKSTPLDQDALIESAPDRFYLPKYIGSKGWIGLRLDLGSIDWDEVEELLHDAYRLQATKRLAATLPERGTPARRIAGRLRR